MVPPLFVRFTYLKTITRYRIYLIHKSQLESDSNISLLSIFTNHRLSTNSKTFRLSHMLSRINITYFSLFYNYFCNTFVSSLGIPNDVYVPSSSFMHFTFSVLVYKIHPPPYLYPYLPYADEAIPIGSYPS